jgi:hypothetical protein
MKLFNEYHPKNHRLIVVLAFVISAPSLLMAEDRPGFYSPEFLFFERNYYDVSFNSSLDNTASTGNNTGVRCTGSDCTTAQFTSSSDMDRYGFGISFATPHINGLSFESSVNYNDWSSSNSQDSWNGRMTTYDTNHADSLRVSGSYLLSDVSMITTSLSQARNTSANQTHRDINFVAASCVSDNLMLSGRISALWGDKHLPNGIKHIGGSLRYSDSFGSIEANGSLDVYSTTMISRSSVVGVATATEEKSNGFGSGGAVYLRHDNSRFGVTASFNGNDLEGSPRNHSFGPQYIFTGSEFEFTVSGNYLVSHSEDVASGSDVISFLDNITKEFRMRYVRDFSNGYYLNASVVRSWNSSGSSIIGTQVQTQNSSNDWGLNLGLTKRF